MSELHIWTDGSCLNNGKNNAMCGIGIFYKKDSQLNVSSALPPGKFTNNRAELCAILYALCTNKADQDIVIHTDSRYSINCITVYAPKWKLNGWKTTSNSSVEWANIISYIISLIEKRNKRGGKTRFIHVKGHSHDSNNNAADLLARNAALHGNIDRKILFLVAVCKVPFD
ncbi:ribonuclease H-like domain-containing protein, partial [Aspergillus nidulans var. acristatus]